MPLWERILDTLPVFVRVTASVGATEDEEDIGSKSELVDSGCCVSADMAVARADERRGTRSYMRNHESYDKRTSAYAALETLGQHL